MHRHDALQGEEVVEDREYRFLDFSCIGSIANKAQSLRKIQNNKRVGGSSVNDRDPFERRETDDGEFRGVPAILVIGTRENEHVAGEKRVPCMFADNPHRHAVLRIGAGKAILNKDIFSLQEALHPIDEVVELLDTEGAVVLSPPDMLFRAWFPYDKFIVRGPSGMFSGMDHQRAELRNPSLTTEGDFLIQCFGRKVPVGFSNVRNAMVVQSIVAFNGLGFVLSRRLDI